MSTAAGQAAESAAAEWLEAQGYAIVDRNWRTKWCEIDLIARKSNRLFFIEVKYRRTNSAGGGLSYITAGKLRQMAFAAQLWLSNHQDDSDYELSAIALGGTPPAIEEFIPQLT